MQFDPYDFQQTDINGVPVFYKKIDIAPCIHIRIVFDYGSFHDDKDKEGVAHFLEHMLFDGNDIYEDKKAIEAFNKKYMLNTLNANTSFFELKVVGKCLPENFEKAIEGMFNMITTSKFNQKDFDDEKKVITQEAWRYLLNDKYLSYVKRYINNNDSIPDRKRMSTALGWPDTIQKITHEDIVNAHAQYIVKNNMKIFIAGNIEDNLLPLLTQYIDKLKAGEKSKQLYVPDIILNNKVNKFENTRASIGLTDKKQTLVSMEILLPRIKDREEESKFISTGSLLKRVLYDIMHEKFRLENSWCYSVDANFSVSKDRFSVGVDSEINPDNKDEAIGVMYQIFEDLKGEKYRNKFEEIKQALVDSIISAERLSADILDTAVSDYQHMGEIIPLHRYLDNAKAVTFENIKSFAEKYLVKEKILEEIVVPDKRKILGIF